MVILLLCPLLLFCYLWYEASRSSRYRVFLSFSSSVEPIIYNVCLRWTNDNRKWNSYIGFPQELHCGYNEKIYLGKSHSASPQVIEIHFMDETGKAFCGTIQTGLPPKVTGVLFLFLKKSEDGYNLEFHFDRGLN